MAEGQRPPSVGDEWSGYVWNGSAWVPRVDGSGRVFDGVRWSGGPTTGQGAAGGYQQALFANQHYAYGLTRQTSDDLQFIARYAKILIIVTLVLAALSLIGLLFSLLTLGSLVAMLPR